MGRAVVTGGICGCLAFVISAALLVLVAWRPGRVERAEDHDGPPATMDHDGPPATMDQLVDYILDNVSGNNIRDFLFDLTSVPCLGGTEDEWEAARWIKDTWQEYGFDHVHQVPYNVMLSYPSETEPNLVRVVDGSGAAVWQSAAKQPMLYTKEEGLPDLPFTFNGFAAPGNVTGLVVYANYGRPEDFQLLVSQGVNLTGCIVLARYGRVFRANIVEGAERLGAVGVVFYSDPSDYAPLGPDHTYPHAAYMPPQAAPFGTVKLVDGDPLTPFYPATRGAFHIPLEEAAIPKIPAHPISYADASHILSAMQGPEAPAEWRGGLDVTYRLGPGFTDPTTTLNLQVNNHYQPTTTYNVIGVIKGTVEPDRYVVVGNHYDSWLLGSLDPSSGTAAMMELARLLSSLKTTGWRPRRSIVFCAWGAEEYGLVASVEWTEQFAKQLGQRAVAYINVDMAIEGNYTLRTKSAPLLYDLMYESAKQVPNPDPDEVSQGRVTVYDTWALRQPHPARPTTPKMLPIGSGSDYKGFQHNLGVPSVDFRYTHDKTTLGEPLYHTLYETFALVDELYDRGFHYHTAVTQLWAIVTVKLSTLPIISFSLGSYGEFVSRAHQDFMARHGDLLTSHNVTLDYFHEAVQQFNQSCRAFSESLQTLNTSSHRPQDVLAVRAANDQLMMVERAFIDTQGLPHRPEYNHVLAAPSTGDAYSGTAFPGLSDALAAVAEAAVAEAGVAGAGAAGDGREQQWRTFQHHLAAVTHALNTAAKVLTDDLW